MSKSLRIAQDAFMTNRGDIPCDHCGRIGILHKWDVPVKIKGTEERKKVTVYLCHESWTKYKEVSTHGVSEGLNKILKEKLNEKN